MLRSTLAAALALLMTAAPALAQETDEATAPEQAPAEAPAGQVSEVEGSDGGFDMGEPVSEADPADPETLQEGAPYPRDQFGDWTIACVRTAEGADPCQLYQLLTDADGNAVAEVTLFPLPGDGPAAGANIVAPMETFLPAQLTLSVDGGEPRRYPFTFCTGRPFSPFLATGCVARIGFSQGQIDQFKRGAAATISLAPAADPEEVIELTMSLTGFTAAYETGESDAAE
ncbi:MAG: invasion associated locus B family protein [Paracoccaceae bacterium]